MSNGLSMQHNKRDLFVAVTVVCCIYYRTANQQFISNQSYTFFAGNTHGFILDTKRKAQQIVQSN